MENKTLGVSHPFKSMPVKQYCHVAKKTNNEFHKQVESPQRNGLSVQIK